MSIRRCLRVWILAPAAFAASIAALGCGEPSQVGTVKMDKAVQPGLRKPPEGQPEVTKPRQVGKSIKDRPEQ